MVKIKGEVIERHSKNAAMSTGDVEIKSSHLTVLNAADTPPFTIEEESDGGEELRMKYRYLDLRRAPLQRNLALRNRVNIEVRKYLDQEGFMDIETPFLIKSTPEAQEILLSRPVCRKVSFMLYHKVRKHLSNCLW